MERGAGGGHHQHAGAAATSVATTNSAAAAASTGQIHDYRHEYDCMTAEEQRSNSSSFDNPTTTAKKKPPKLKSINRSASMAIDNYAPTHVGPFSAGSGGIPDNTFIIEQPLIHRSASPLPMRSTPPPQTLNIIHTQHAGGSSGAISPALSSRQKHHMQTFQHLAAQARHHKQQHSSSTSSPILHGASMMPNCGVSYQQQPDIYLVSSTSLGDENVLSGGSGSFGGSTSPIQFIDDYMLPSTHHTRHTATSVTHPLKKSLFRRSDTIDVHPASTFQMKKTHSFHVPHDTAQVTGTIIDPLLLKATSGGSGSQQSSGVSSRRTSSVRANFLMPSQTGSQMSRSPSPSRRGYRSHRSFHDPQRRPNDNKPDTEIRHPSLNDDILETLDGVGMHDFSSTNRSLENELFIETRSRSNSHTKMDEITSMEQQQQQQQQQQRIIRKSSGSFEENVIDAHSTDTHPPISTSSLKKREIPHARQHSTHSLDIDGRPTVTTSAIVSHTHAQPPTLQLHSAAAAAQAAYHFKRGAQHGRSLYLSPNNLSPNNLEELPLHRSGVLAASAAAAFQGTNASANVKQARALHSASMRLRTYRDTLSASKKSKSFIAEGFPPPLPLATVVGGNDFELTSPHRRNSRPLSSAAVSGEPCVEDIKRSPRPMVIASTSAAAGPTVAGSAFIEEKRPSFERKSSLTYELSDAAFEQVLRPFHHKVAAGRKASMTGSHKAMKKKSLSDETDDDEEADRKRKRIVCIVMTVFLCLVFASVLVVILTLTHSSGQSHTHHPTTKKIYTFTRETPVHYNVRQENERLMKETMDRARFGKNFTETASLISTAAQLISSSTLPLQQQLQQQQHHQQHEEHQQHNQEHHQQPLQH